MVDPSKPSSHRPGSEEKVELLALGHALGLPLNVEEDLRLPAEWVITEARAGPKVRHAHVAEPVE